MSNKDSEPVYSGNAGHGSRPLDIIDPHSSAIRRAHPGSSLRDFVSPPPADKTAPGSTPGSTPTFKFESTPPSSHTATPPLGLAGHGSRGPFEGLDADHLRHGVGSVRDVTQWGEGGEDEDEDEEEDEEKMGYGDIKTYNEIRGYTAEGERRGYGGFAGRCSCIMVETVDGEFAGILRGIGRGSCAIHPGEST